MCQFIETIRIERGEVHHIKYHNERMNETRNAFWKGCPTLDLMDYIKAPHTALPIKCRVVYGKTIEEVSYNPYELRPVRSLRLLCADSVEYNYKSTDREAINSLFSKRGGQDDVLFIKEGFVTDTSIANIALRDADKWYTPKNPLLKGTQRAYLLDRGFITEKNIKAEDIYYYSQMVLFNAMIDFGRIKIDISPCNIAYNEY